MSEASLPTFPDADFYDCCDRERLSFESPEEAIAEYLESYQVPGADTSALIREHSPVVVTCYRRGAGPTDKWIGARAEHCLEVVAEVFEEEWGDPDGNDAFDGGAHAEAQPAMVAVLKKFLAHATVWPCERCGEVSLEAEQVEAMMREHCPDWWEP